MANVVLKKDGDPTAGAPSKGGEYYDNCPNADCGQRDVERNHKFGGRDGKGEEHLNWSMYHCGGNDGCGVNWTRTTKQGREYFERRGKKPSKWHTNSGDAGRYTSVPSDEFRDRFDLIDWSK